MESLTAMTLSSLGTFFATLEQFSWLGSVTNIVHLEDTIIDQTVGNLATQLAMQVPLMKVPPPPSLHPLTLSFGLVHPHLISCHSIWCHHEMDPITNSQASLFDDRWDLIDAMDLRE